MTLIPIRCQKVVKWCALAACWLPSPTWAGVMAPPTRIDVAPGAGRASVAREPQPKAGMKLPMATVGTAKPKPKPKPKPRTVKPKPRAAPKITEFRRPRGPGFRVHLDVGQVTVPRSIVTLAGQVNQFPDLTARTVDISVVRTGGNHAWGGRLGLLFPQVPAANWYLSTSDAERPVYTEIDLVGVDLAFTYGYRRRLLGPLGVALRAGAGMTIAAGSVRRSQTIPTCAPSQFATCPHWRKAATDPNALPSAVWPALRATGGLFVEFGKFSATIEAGLRSVVFVGAGFAVRM